MCGRFLLNSPAQVIAEAFGVPEPAELAPRWNIAPGQTIAAVRAPGEARGGAGARELAWLRWGLIPAWAKEAPRDARLINARAETAPEKPAFRSAFRTRRCLVPASGFYEWQATGGRAKQPFAIGVAGGGPFAIAGLWEVWRPREGPTVESCTLLTTDANALVRPIHDRMPVILPPESWEPWLDPALRDVERLRPLLRPFPAGQMTAVAVSAWVNNPRHDDPRCVEPA